MSPGSDGRFGFPHKSGPFFAQDAEKARQLRSRIVQTLNVPQRVRLGPSLAAALLDGLFEHPANRRVPTFVLKPAFPQIDLQLLGLIKTSHH